MNALYRILKYLLVVTPLTFGASVHAAQPIDGLRLPDERTVLRGGWIYDSLSGKVKRNDGIVVLNGKFFQVGGNVQERDIAGARVINLADDEYALPGLIDMHAHYDVMLVSQATGLRRVDELAVNPIVYLANGVTSTFTAGEFNPEATRDTRLRIDRGEQIGPRIFQAGPKFGKVSPRWHEDATPADVQLLVDHWAALGVTSFKAYGLERYQLEALIQRAHQYGLTVTCHCMGFDHIRPKEAVLMGIDRVEHYMDGNTFDSPAMIDPSSSEFTDIAKLFLRHHVYFDSTITRFSFLGQGPKDVAQILPYWEDERAIFTPWIQTKTRSQKVTAHPQPWPGFPERLRQTVKAFYEMGGRDLITMGTDNPSTGYYLAGFDDHRELANLVLAGIPPSDALRMGTINGARALNVEDRLGSIDTGKWADLFIVHGNPLTDIHNTRAIRLVMKAGQVYNPRDLLRSVQGKLGPANHDEEKVW